MLYKDCRNLKIYKVIIMVNTIVYQVMINTRICDYYYLNLKKKKLKYIFLIFNLYTIQERKRRKLELSAMIKVKKLCTK